MVSRNVGNRFHLFARWASTIDCVKSDSLTECRNVIDSHDPLSPEKKTIFADKDKTSLLAKSVFVHYWMTKKTSIQEKLVYFLLTANKPPKIALIPQ